MLNFTRSTRPKLWKGVVAGIAGGLAGTIVMTQFQNCWKKMAKHLRENNTESPAGTNSESQPQENKEDATMKAAGKIAEVVGYELTHRQKEKAGPAVHYGFGTGMGVVYGVLREVEPGPMRRLNPAVAGISYGSALFLAADELIVPALGLSQSPKEIPASSHAYGFASHAIFGLTAEMVRRAIRKHL